MTTCTQLAGRFMVLVSSLELSKLTVMLEMLSSRRMLPGSSMGSSYTLFGAKVERSMVPTDKVESFSIWLSGPATFRVCLLRE